jgi:hypothetical protein
MGYSFILRHKERFLEPAQRLIWWMKPEEALEHPLRLVTQIMDIGTLSDLRLLQDEFTEVELVSILKDAPPGVLSARSLRFWQVVLKTEAKPQPRFPGSDVTGRVWSQG